MRGVLVVDRDVSGAVWLYVENVKKKMIIAVYQSTLYTGTWNNAGEAEDAAVLPDQLLFLSLFFGAE